MTSIDTRLITSKALELKRDGSCTKDSFVLDIKLLLGAVKETKGSSKKTAIAHTLFTYILCHGPHFFREYPSLSVYGFFFAVCRKIYQLSIECPIAMANYYPIFLQRMRAVIESNHHYKAYIPLNRGDGVLLDV